MKMYKDADGVELVETATAENDYPFLNWESVVNRFAWDNKDGVEVMTLGDLFLCVRLHEENLIIDDIEYADVVWCSVCGVVCLPDDEAYTDEETGLPLCGQHAEFNEETDMYRKTK